MAMSRGALAVQVSYDPRPIVVCETLNRLIQQAAGRRYLVTFCYAVLDGRQERLQWISAGHPLYLMRHTREVETLSSPGFPLGVRMSRFWQPEETRFEMGDVLFMCSDGIVEAVSPSGEPFRYDRLADGLRDTLGRPVPEIREELLRRVETYAGPAAAADDRAILIVSRLSTEIRWADLDRYTQTVPKAENENSTHTDPHIPKD